VYGLRLQLYSESTILLIYILLGEVGHSSNPKNDSNMTVSIAKNIKKTSIYINPKNGTKITQEECLNKRTGNNMEQSSGDKGGSEEKES